MEMVDEKQVIKYIKLKQGVVYDAYKTAKSLLCSSNCTVGIYLCSLFYCDLLSCTIYTPACFSTFYQIQYYWSLL